MMSLSVTMLTLLVGAPVVRWLVNRDLASTRINRSLVSRHYLNLAILISICLVSVPFVNKPVNYFERFNTIVSADPSTVYQQFKRTQTWIDAQVEAGTLDPEVGEAKKSHNERIQKVLHSSASKNLYLKFGDILGKSILRKSVEEPSFLYCAAYAMNHVIWVGSIVALVCPFLPQGGLVATILILLAMFCLELEWRFIDAQSIYTGFFFLTASQWATFEILVAMKQAFVGIVCFVVILATLFASPGGAERTKTNLRNLLKSNAALVTVLKDPTIKELNITKDEVYAGENNVDINRIVIGIISGMAILGTVLIPSE